MPYEGNQPTAARPENENRIPYHQAYFGCCNRTVMTRADIQQPFYCPFCGKALAADAPAQPAGELREAAQDVIAWEESYRTLNHLGKLPPQPFRRLLAALGREK